MELTGAFDIAPTVQSIKLLGKTLINIALKGAQSIERPWFNTQIIATDLEGYLQIAAFYIFSSYSMYLSNPSG